MKLGQIVGIVIALIAGFTGLFLLIRTDDVASPMLSAGGEPSLSQAEAPREADGLKVIQNQNRPHSAPSESSSDGSPIASTARASLLEDKGRRQERRTSMVMPSAFNLKAFEKDPASYLNTVEPGRIHQTAKPGPSVPVLSADGVAAKTVSSLESVELAVFGASNAPVTFHSSDRGAFGNGLTTQTVRADEKGRAVVEFTATKGTVEDVNIVVASPLAVGKVNFWVYVEVAGKNSNL